MKNKRTELFCEEKASKDQFNMKFEYSIVFWQTMNIKETMKTNDLFSFQNKNTQIHRLQDYFNDTIGHCSWLKCCNEIEKEGKKCTILLIFPSLRRDGELREKRAFHRIYTLINVNHFRTIWCVSNQIVLILIFVDSVT